MDRVQMALDMFTAQLRKDLASGPVTSYTVDEDRSIFMSRIEDLMLRLLQALCEGQPPVIQVPNLRRWENMHLIDSCTHLKRGAQCKMVEVRWAAPRSRAKFALLVVILARIHKLLASRTSITRRSLYYEFVDSVKSQSRVDEAVREVSALLDAPSWRLGLLATSKGLLHGPVRLHHRDGVVTDCSLKAGGELVPEDVSSLEAITSERARFVLVVEKDAVFQHLLAQQAQDFIGPHILVTGKGFPDVNTRLLLRRLWDSLRIPVFALVDADPHGIEIMCVYRHGSLSLSHEAADLVVPAVRWLGLLPTELQSLGMETQPLSPTDVTKLTDLQQRPYVNADANGIRLQMRTLLDHGRKAEIEAIYKLSSSYLARGYLPNKIACLDFI